MGFRHVRVVAKSPFNFIMSVRLTSACNISLPSWRFSWNLVLGTVIKYVLKHENLLKLDRNVWHIA